MLDVSKLIAAWQIDLPVEDVARRLDELRAEAVQREVTPALWRRLEEIRLACSTGVAHVSELTFAAKFLADRKNDSDRAFARTIVDSVLPIMALDISSQVDRQCADRRQGRGVPYGNEVMEARLLLERFEELQGEALLTYLKSESALLTLEHIADYVERETVALVRAEGKPLVQRYADDIRIIVALQRSWS